MSVFILGNDEYVNYRKFTVTLLTSKKAWISYGASWAAGITAWHATDRVMRGPYRMNNSPRWRHHKPIRRRRWATWRGAWRQSNALVDESEHTCAEMRWRGRWWYATAASAADTWTIASRSLMLWVKTAAVCQTLMFLKAPVSMITWAVMKSQTFSERALYLSLPDEFSKWNMKLHSIFFPCLFVCLLARLLKKRVHRFRWNVACRQMLGHGRTD